MSVRLRESLLAAILLLGACGQFPKDPRGTIDRVRERGTFRVGIIAGEKTQTEQGQVLLARIADATKAKPILVHGTSEPLLLDLEVGKLDLVLGTFDEKTPWGTRVTVGPPLQQSASGKIHHQFAPVMRNGENAWISLVEREVRNLGPENL